MGGLDRRKHDVDVIERVLNNILDDTDDGPTRVFDVDVPWVSGSRDQTLELMLGIDGEDDGGTDSDSRQS
jgi:hypothetical protein